MKTKNKSSNLFIEIVALLCILTILYFIFKTVNDIEIFFGIIMLSFGVLAVIWTLLAKYNLSPKSTLRLFTNNFLSCSISVLFYSIIRLLSDFVSIPFHAYLEFFFISITFFFFVLVSYYIYIIGNEFGFQKESSQIKKALKKKA